MISRAVLLSSPFSVEILPANTARNKEFVGEEGRKEGFNVGGRKDEEGSSSAFRTRNLSSNEDGHEIEVSVRLERRREQKCEW